MKNVYKAVKAAASVMLVLAMVLSGMLTAAGAYIDVPKIYSVQDTYYNASPGEIAVSAVEGQSLEEYLIQELTQFPEYVDIIRYNIPITKINELLSIIFDNCPELFHLSNSMRYSTSSGKIYKIYPSYMYTPEEYGEMYDECIVSADKILGDIRGNEKLSDVEKALLIHDRLAVLCEYDNENLQNGTLSDESYSMYGALVNTFAVCQGYAEAYLYLLKQVGIDSYLCESEQLYHAWNIVIIDGEEYHVDVTWDDPVNDITGRVNHNNFLRSTEGIYSTGHTASDYVTTPDSGKYDSFFWQSSSSAFCLIGDEIYYIDGTDSYIKKYSDRSQVKEVSDMWMSGASSYYPGCYARLSSYGEKLYYNSSQAVFELNPETGASAELWRPVSVNQYYRIYGFKYADNYLICDFNSSPNFTSATKSSYQQRKYLQPVTLTGIAINTYPEKQQFDIGEAYSSDGLSLLLSYSNNTTKVVSDGFTVSGADTASEGIKTATVTYNGFTATYTFNVQCAHKSVSNVSAAPSTCVSQGHGAYTRCNICNRVISGSDVLLPLASHNYSSEITKPATHLKEGTETFTCQCGDTYTESVARLEGHTYTAVVAPPTCAEKGYTTFTCACGDSYISDYVNKLEHISRLADKIPATSTENGYTGDTVCTLCGEILEEGEIIPATDDGCKHICHKSGFWSILWKIIIFFTQKSEVNSVCECGAAHY